MKTFEELDYRKKPAPLRSKLSLLVRTYDLGKVSERIMDNV